MITEKGTKRWRVAKLVQIETVARKVRALSSQFANVVAELDALQREFVVNDEPAPERRAAFDGPLEVVAQVAERLGATLADATGGRRFPGAIRARQAAVLALRQLGLSYPEVASLLGYSDHSAALAAARVAKEREAEEPAFQDAVAVGVVVGRTLGLTIMPSAALPSSRRAPKHSGLRHGAAPLNEKCGCAKCKASRACDDPVMRRSPPTDHTPQGLRVPARAACRTTSRP